MRRSARFLALAVAFAPLGVPALAADAPVVSGPGPLVAGVAATARGDGWVFADERGMTLYTYDRDEGKPGASACNGPCATAWPPLPAPTGATPPPGWSTITREDGSLQWAYRGKPLYRYAADAFPGATFGDGVETVWRVAFRSIALPREVKIGQTVLGNVLTDARGITLYASDDDRPGKVPACEGKCLTAWQPVAAPWLAQSFGDWSAVVRADGTRQWAFKGKPLYLWFKDQKPGDATGDGVNNVWHTAKP